MPTLTTILPSNTPLTFGGPVMSREWYNYFTGQNRVANAAVAGEVSTLPGSGLEGGGPVSDGLTLSIAPGGVTNAMLRNSLPTSVIGRFQNSSGDPADIQAVANDRVLARQGNQLVFTNFLENLVSLQAQTVVYDNLETSETPSASAATTTHRIPIETASGTMYLLLSNVP